MSVSAVAAITVQNKMTQNPVLERKKEVHDTRARTHPVYYVSVGVTETAAAAATARYFELYSSRRTLFRSNPFSFHASISFV